VAARQAGWASAWRPGPAEEVARGAGTGCALQARSPRAVCARDCAVARWWLSGGNVLSMSSRGQQGLRRQGGQGRSSPERRSGMEAVEKSQDNDVRRWGE
jgi:hypothetical protein